MSTPPIIQTTTTQQKYIQTQMKKPKNSKLSFCENWRRKRRRNWTKRTVGRESAQKSSDNSTKKPISWQKWSPKTPKPKKSSKISSKKASSSAVSTRKISALLLMPCKKFTLNQEMMSLSKVSKVTLFTSYPKGSSIASKSSTEPKLILKHTSPENFSESWLWCTMHPGQLQ